MIATDVTTPFFTPLNRPGYIFFCYCAFCVISSLKFIAPALYRNERFKMLLFICVSSILFTLVWHLPILSCVQLFKIFCTPSARWRLSQQISRLPDFSLFFAFGLALKYVFTTLCVLLA